MCACVSTCVRLCVIPGVESCLKTRDRPILRREHRAGTPCCAFGQFFLSLTLHFDLHPVKAAVLDHCNLLFMLFIIFPCFQSQLQKQYRMVTSDTEPKGVLLRFTRHYSSNYDKRIISTCLFIPFTQRRAPLRHQRSRQLQLRPQNNTGPRLSPRER